MFRQQLSDLFYRVGKANVTAKLKELDEFQWKSSAEIARLQQQYLYQTLRYAGLHIPYYRNLFRQIGFQPEEILEDVAAIQKIPPLSKSLIRQNADRLITTEAAKQAELYKIKTGGTTGEPLNFTKDAVYRNYNIAHDYHVMTWAGWQIGQPQFWLWGHVPDADGPSASLVTQAKVTQAKEYLAARYDSNAFILGDDSMGKFAAQIQKKPGGILWSYVSTAHRFAQFIKDKNYTNLHLKAVYTAAEPLFESQRQLVQDVFRAPVFNNYSSIDTGDIASECDQHKGLHILARNCYVEVLRDGRPVPDGEEGEFVITTLTNFGAPLIRYQIEDWGRKSDRQCACGRGLPMLEVVEGRKIDLFKTQDGRTVYGAFAKDLIPTLGDVRQFQVVQKSLDLLVFKIVHKGNIDQKRLARIVQVSKDALGENVEVRFEFVDHLPATPTGKHRYLVSDVK